MRSREDPIDQNFRSDIQSSEESEYGSESEDSLMRNHSRRVREGRRRQNIHDIANAYDEDAERMNRESRAKRAQRR
jgi:hypothetical protein